MSRQSHIDPVPASQSLLFHYRCAQLSRGVGLVSPNSDRLELRHCISVMPEHVDEGRVAIVDIQSVLFSQVVSSV